MRFGSLFAGIGGIDLGLEAAGMMCAFQVEIDPKCRRVLDYYWPDVPKFGDITQVKGSDLPSVDLLAGGFPCQPVSIAGRQKGQKDVRWLWPAFGRLIGELRPRYVLVENVPGLLAQEEAFGEVLTQLAALGYDAEWTCLRAADFGATHRRERLFLVAYPQRTQWRSKPTPRIYPEQRSNTERQETGRTAQYRRSMGDSPSDGRLQGRAVSSQLLRQPGGSGDGAGEDVGNSERLGLEGRLGHHDRREWDAWPPGPTDDVGWRRVLTTRPDLAPALPVEPKVRGVAHGLSTRLSRTDQLKMLGNAVVPVCAEYVGRLILEHAKIAY